MQKPRTNRLLSRFFRDEQGEIVIFQAPNVWLYGWLGFKLTSLLFSGTVADLAGWLGTAFIGIWAVLELGWGVNYFRRLLGLVVVIATLGGSIMRLGG